MKSTRSYGQSVGAWRVGWRRRPLLAAVFVIVMAALFTLGRRSSPAVAATGASSYSQDVAPDGVEPCDPVSAGDGRLLPAQARAGNETPSLTVGARRYVAAWPRAVFDHFTAVEKWPALLDVAEVCGLQEPVAVGSRFAMRLWSGSEVEGVITAWDPDRAFAAQLVVEGMRRPIDFNLTVEAVPDGSEVQLDVGVEPRGALYLLLPATGADGQVGRYLDLVLRRVKAGVER